MRLYRTSDGLRRAGGGWHRLWADTSLFWTPTRFVGHIRVRRLDSPTSTSGTEIWFVFDASRSIDRGIIFGSRGTASETLQPAQTYEVSVGEVVGEDAISMVGGVTFTR